MTGFQVSTDDLEPAVSIGPRAAVNIDQLIHPGRKEIGSVEGRLNVISLAGRAPRFVLYETITRKAVSCRFTTERLEEIKAALGRRVLVTGLVTFNRKEEPQKITLESLLASARGVTAGIRGRTQDSGLLGYTQQLRATGAFSDSYSSVSEWR